MALNSSRAVMAVVIAVFLSVATVTSAPSYGAIVSAFVSDDEFGDGDAVIDDNVIYVEKEYEQVGPISLEFEVDSDSPVVQIVEEIENETGTDWLDFHFEIVDGDAIFSDVTLPFPFPFTIIETDDPDFPKKVWLLGGTVPDDNEFDIGFEITILGFWEPGTTETIRIEQLPTVPIPAALWLFASGLIVLIGAARRRKLA